MRKKPKEQQTYILTKYVRASSAEEAIRLDKSTKVHEVDLKSEPVAEYVAGFDTSWPDTDEESLWEDKKKKKC